MVHFMDPELYKRGESYLVSEQEAWVFLFPSTLGCVYGLTMAAPVPALLSSKRWRCVQNLGVFRVTAVRAPHCKHTKDIHSKDGYQNKTHSPSLT